MHILLSFWCMVVSHTGLAMNTFSFAISLSLPLHHSRVDPPPGKCTQAPQCELFHFFPEAGRGFYFNSFPAEVLNGTSVHGPELNIIDQK